MANDQVTMSRAAMCDVANVPPTSRQDCSDVIHIGVFFDGTGNNKDADTAKKKWSNIARIWQAGRLFANANRSANAYPIYISGVGTPFNGKPISPSDPLEIAIEDKMFGLATGMGGTRRLNFGQQQINDALRTTLLGKARALDGQVAQYAKAGKQKSFAELNRVLGQHRLIKQINVSIFGFSRGAALARAFCNQWLWQCKEDHGQLTYEGYPIRFVFLGLFDTVASFGLPAANLSNSLRYGGFQGRDLVVDDRVERCVHFVAAHELRFAFPVDLIRRDGHLAGDWLERVYPGVHADIGGGYEPMEQGINANYSRIPMRDMMREAQLRGVRIMGYENLAKDKSYKALFQERFECLSATEAAYKGYKAACNPRGTVEQQVQKHMEQLYSAYGTLHRQKGKSVTQRVHKQNGSWSPLAPDDMATELDNYQRALHDLVSLKGMAAGAANPTYLVRKLGYALWIKPEHWQLGAWKRAASPAVLHFIHTYVHDSKAGFLMNAEPFSYFSKRGMAESSHSVQGWFEKHVARPVDHVYEATADAVSNGVEKIAETAREISKAGQQGAKEAAKILGNAWPHMP